MLFVLNTEFQSQLCFSVAAVVFATRVGLGRDITLTLSVLVIHSSQTSMTSYKERKAVCSVFRGTAMYPVGEESLLTGRFCFLSISFSGLTHVTLQFMAKHGSSLTP